MKASMLSGQLLQWWFLAHAILSEALPSLRSKKATLPREAQPLVPRSLGDNAVDPYSGVSLNSSFHSAALVLQANAFYIDFFGVKMCFPGYVTPDCVSRLQPANSWYTQDCPNLQDQAGNTFDINTATSQLGGHTGCSGYHGEEVSPCAYLCYAHPSYGTAMIPNTVWKNAQYQEHAWAQNTGAQGVSDDRSLEHFEGFGNYASIPGKLGQLKIIEVGSGPWTQTKGLLHMRPDLQVSELTLFEPAAQWYIQNVATCSYKSGKLQKFQQLNAFHEFPVKVVGSGGELLTSHTIQYDALIVMNVIEHVQNAFYFLSGLHHVLKPGGLLIFHERFFESPPSADPLLGNGALHPIRITKNVLDVFVGQFDTIRLNTRPTTGMSQRGLGEQGYYFIGRKKLS